MLWVQAKDTVPIGTRSELRALAARKQELCELHNQRGNSLLGPSFDWWINEDGIIDPTITAERKALQASIKDQVAVIDRQIKHLSKRTPAEGLAGLAVLAGAFAMLTAVPYLLLLPLGLESIAVAIASIYYLVYAAKLNDGICWRGRRR